MRELLIRWKAFKADEEGQTAVEYMLIIAVIVAVIFALGKTFKSRFQSLVNTVFNQIDRKVKAL